MPISPMQMSFWAKLIKAGKKPWYMLHSPWRKWMGELYDINSGRKTHYNPSEIAKVADMIVFLREDKMCLGNPRRKIDHKLYHYTCRHFDSKTKNCTNYEDRPDMCRAYPNSRICKYKGCTRVCENKPTAADIEFDKKMADA